MGVGLAITQLFTRARVLKETFHLKLKEGIEQKEAQTFFSKKFKEANYKAIYIYMDGMRSAMIFLAMAATVARVSAAPSEDGRTSLCTDQGELWIEFQFLKIWSS